MIFIENGSKRQGEEANCRRCGKQFIRRVVPYPNKMKKQFCSVSCLTKSNITSISVKCFQCGKDFLRRPSRNRKFNFCSRICKEKSQSLTSNNSQIWPSHYGVGTTTGTGRKSVKNYKNSVTKKMMNDGCVDCGLKIKYMLNFHHIDGNRLNSDTSNLEIVCFNHHALRHLKEVDGIWIYCSAALTPRHLLSKFAGSILAGMAEQQTPLIQKQVSP